MAPADEEPAWDEAAAASLIGSIVLLGLTYVRPEGDRHEQMFGRVASADQRGISIRLDGQRTGEVFHLPPDLQPFETAAPGAYRLKSTGEVLVDPDYLCTWTIHPRS